MADLISDLQRYKRASQKASKLLEELRPRIDKAISQGAPQAQIAREMGWSRQRFREWRKANEGETLPLQETEGVATSLPQAMRVTTAPASTGADHIFTPGGRSGKAGHCARCGVHVRAHG